MKNHKPVQQQVASRTAESLCPLAYPYRRSRMGGLLKTRQMQPRESYQPYLFLPSQKFSPYAAVPFHWLSKVDLRHSRLYTL